MYALKLESLRNGWRNFVLSFGIFIPMFSGDG